MISRAIFILVSLLPLSNGMAQMYYGGGLVCAYGGASAVYDNFPSSQPQSGYLIGERSGEVGYSKIRAEANCNRLHSSCKALFTNWGANYLSTADAIASQGSVSVNYGGSVSVYHPNLPIGTLVSITVLHSISGDRSPNIVPDYGGYSSYYQGGLNISNGNLFGPAINISLFHQQGSGSPNPLWVNPNLAATFTAAVGQTIAITFTHSAGVYINYTTQVLSYAFTDCTSVFEWSSATPGVELRHSNSSIKLCGQVIPGKDNTCIQYNPQSKGYELCFTTNTDPGKCVALQQSDDFQTWSTLATMMTNPNKSVNYTDFPDVSITRRFYRVIPCPGRYLVYQRLSNSGVGSIWRCKMDGSEDFKITDGYFPRVSPDGRYLAFLKKQSGSTTFAGTDIYLRDLATLAESTTPIYNNTSTTDDIHGLSFSADGGVVAFDIGNNTSGYLIRTVPRAGGSATTVPGLTAGCSQVAPNIDPSGSGKFVFHERNPGRITQANVVGSGEIPLTASGNGDSWPQYSWNGQWIAYVDGNVGVTQFDQGHDLKLISPSGNQTRTLTSLDPGDGFPYGAIWTTDHQSLIGAASIQGQSGIWQVASDGTGSRKLIQVSSGDAPVFVGGVIP